MKKYSLFVITPHFPIGRLVQFTVIYDSVLAYHMKSETMDLWIRKGTLARLIDKKEALTPSHCELFTEVTP